MIRNREVKKLIITLIILTIIITIIAATFSDITAIFVLATALLFIIIFFYFTNWRYREIAKLSQYLRQVGAGNYSLDLRDNYEGELSILKSEIYKMTLMLTEQGEQLQDDKIHLMNALSDISHQLKTPLTSMTVMADLLENPALPLEKRNEFNHNIQVQLKRIEWLVSSLLKLSKIDAGAVYFKKDIIYVNQLIKDSLQPMLIPIDIKEIDLKINSNNEATFLGDLHWTTEALINIIKNCVEHLSDKNILEITFSENALYTEIIISDSGTGIPKEELPHIFKRFYKGKNANVDSIGIGLAMAYTIITSQNGSIDVESEVDNGTTFVIKFYKQVV